MTLLLWAGFIALILVFLAVDLGVFHRKAHVITVTEALLWTTTWVILALLFNACIYWLYEHHVFGIGLTVGHELSGGQAALEFFTGYVIEKSLSLDNIFVIALIFSYFNIPAIYQHRVLVWGIIGVLVMRGVMIAAGAALIHRFYWITYVFGGLLLFTAIKMLVAKHENVEPDKNPLVRLARRFYPISSGLDGDRFFTRIEGKRALTPLALVLLVVESTDVLFAVDSIPAIFAVTRDPFIVFTSNVFAILGLRSLYMVLSGVMARFRYLKLSLVVLLLYIGVKLLLTHYYHIPTVVSLGIIAGILAVGVVASLLSTAKGPIMPIVPVPRELEDVAAYSWRQVRRVVMLLVGAVLVLIGLAMIVLPGPAFLVIPSGLAILGAEFLWARQLVAKMKAAGLSLFRRVRPERESPEPSSGIGPKGATTRTSPSADRP